MMIHGHGTKMNGISSIKLARGLIIPNYPTIILRHKNALANWNHHINEISHIIVSSFLRISIIFTVLFSLHKISSDFNTTIEQSIRHNIQSQSTRFDPFSNNDDDDDNGASCEA